MRDRERVRERERESERERERRKRERGKKRTTEIERYYVCVKKDEKELFGESVY